MRARTYASIDRAARRAHEALKTGSTSVLEPVPIADVVQFEMDAVFGYSFDVGHLDPGVDAYPRSAV